MCSSAFLLIDKSIKEEGRMNHGPSLADIDVK